MTKAAKIAELKLQHPTISVGSAEVGYTQLSAEDYEATISHWADNLLAIEAVEAEAKATKEAAEAKLAALGLTPDDLKALGL
jgi:hypothetical protein